MASTMRISANLSAIKLPPTLSASDSSLRAERVRAIDEALAERGSTAEKRWQRIEEE